MSNPGKALANPSDRRNTWDAQSHCATERSRLSRPPCLGRMGPRNIEKRTSKELAVPPTRAIDPNPMRGLSSLVGLFLLVVPCAAYAQDGPARTLAQAVAMLCPLPGLSGLDAQNAFPGSWLLTEDRRPNSTDPRVISIRLVLPDLTELDLERRQHNGQLRQFRASLWRNQGSGPEPSMLAIADGSCAIQSGRRLRAEGATWRYLDQLDGDLSTVRWTETLQAPWPDGTDNAGVRVGFIDSGLAYDLPVFRDRLARGLDGQPIGYDYWDLDPWPYDGDTARGPFLPIRHGTAVASVFVREAPEAAIVPYKYPRPDMTRLGEIVARAATDGVRILAMPLGSNDKDDWETFEAALAKHDILAIVSAGNNGRDIDAQPVYPAALSIDRMVTVTSADEFGRLARGSNWGATHVDIMVPAENLEIVDFRGASGVASGSSYAVPRVAALAARLLASNPDLGALALKQAILARATPSPFERANVLATGWLPNPLED